MFERNRVVHVIFNRKVTKKTEIYPTPETYAYENNVHETVEKLWGYIFSAK